MIRAKFRCLNMSKNYENRYGYELQPVMANSPAEEDKSFWEATPSGKAEMNYLLEDGDEEPFELGAYYYIDMVPDDEGDWVINTRTQHATGRRGANGEIVLAASGPGDWRTPGLKHSKLHMGIDNPVAMEAFGDVESKWNVVFTRAPD
jgi:hypothetical protein